MKKIVLFINTLVAVGGGERLMFEEERYFRGKGDKTYILTYDFNKKASFDGVYGALRIKLMNKKTNSGNFMSATLFRILSLREKIKGIKPDLIIAQSAWECIYLYFATMFTSYFYVAHINGTIFWFNENLLKYTLVYKKSFKEIRASLPGHKEFIPIRPPKASLLKKITAEIISLMMFFGVRKAKKIFVFSNQMGWEISKLYGKKAIVLQGAFPKKIFSYKSQKNIRQNLGLKNKKIILTINRLDPRKRTGLLISAFKEIASKMKNVILVIGGEGPDEGRLKKMAKDLNIEDRVKFVGYVKEYDLWDYYSCCDVFAHLNWADFAIAPFEALAFGKKIVWSSEMDVKDSLAKNKLVFATDPEVKKVAKKLEKVLKTSIVVKKNDLDDLHHYSWDQYFLRLEKDCFT